MSTKPGVCSLTLGYDYRDDADIHLNPCIRVLATLSNHYGELGSEAEFLRKAAQIQAVLERPGDPFPIRIFARQDADDVLDASEPSEWVEVAEPEPSHDEVVRRFQEVISRSQALFEETLTMTMTSEPAPRLKPEF